MTAPPATPWTDVDEAPAPAPMEPSEAAQAVIGHMMVSGPLCVAVLGALDPADMPDPWSMAALQAIRQEATEDGVVDIVVVQAEMRALCPDADRKALNAYLVRALEAASLSSQSEGADVCRARCLHAVGYLRRLARQRAVGAAEAALLEARTLTDRRRAAAALERAERARDEVGIVESISALRWDLAEEMERPERPPAEELVERVFTRPSVNIVFGPSQSGKSYGLQQAMLDLIGGGGAWYGHEALQIRPASTRFGGEPDRVLWVFGSEDTTDRVLRRARTIWTQGPHREKPVPAGRYVVRTPPPGVLLGTESGTRWLAEAVASDKPSVLVCDTIASLTDPSSMSSDKAECVGPFLRAFHALRDRAGVTSFLVHHTRKGGADPRRTTEEKADSMLGSQAWRALADGVFLVQTIDGNMDRIALKSIKGKDLTRQMLPCVSRMGPAGRIEAAEDDAADWEAQEAAQEAPGSRGRPRRDLGAELAAEIRSRGRLDVREAARALGLSEGRWRAERARVTDELLGLGYPVVSGAWVSGG